MLRSGWWVQPTRSHQCCEYHQETPSVGCRVQFNEEFSQLVNPIWIESLRLRAAPGQGHWIWLGLRRPNTSPSWRRSPKLPLPLNNWEGRAGAIIWNLWFIVSWSFQPTVLTPPPFLLASSHNLIQLSVYNKYFVKMFCETLFTILKCVHNICIHTYLTYIHYIYKRKELYNNLS